MKKLATPLLLLLMLLTLLLCTLAGVGGFGLPDLQTTAGKNLMELRLARTLVGFLVGAALAGAGCTLQAILRNPLAEPYILGISSGGSLGAALAIMSGLSVLLPLSLPLLAFLGAITTLLVVYQISQRHGYSQSATLILTGVVVSSMLAGLIMLLHSLDTTHRGPGITWWMMGNLQTYSWSLIALAALLIALAALILLAHTRELNALLLGSEHAALLGVRVKVVVPLLLGATTLATAAAVAISGIIGFVGLIVPHALRRLVGANHRHLLPWSIVGGGTFLVLCDTIARLLLAPREIPVGVITALAGGPFFLWLVTQKQHRHVTTPPPRRAPTLTHLTTAITSQATAPAIRLQNVHATLGANPILQDISLTIAPAAMVALIGPNGAGKSTLLRAIAGQFPITGHITIASHRRDSQPHTLARTLAVMPQESPHHLPLCAVEFVLLGRTPWLPRFGGPTAADQAAAQTAMQRTSTWHLRQRPLSAMSGGERQRVALAMALAANPTILLLDEPTSHLDLRHRVELMELLKKLNREHQITLLTVVHDLTLAAQFFPRLLLLADGKITADGTPQQVLQPHLLEAAYHYPLKLFATPDAL